MQASNRRPSPALIVAIIALIAALAGTAWAAGLKKNSVGSRQIKKAAVTSGKIANNAVTEVKIQKHAVTGEKINMEKLGQVPSAAIADRATVASALADGNATHSAGCPASATLIRGICFDKTLSAPVKNIRAAADACAAKGGWLPTPLELYSIRGIVFLGLGTPPDYAASDVFLLDVVSKNNPSSVAVDSTGAMHLISDTEEVKYICAYPLVR